MTGMLDWLTELSTTAKSTQTSPFHVVDCLQLLLRLHSSVECLQVQPGCEPQTLGTRARPWDMGLKHWRTALEERVG